MRNSEEILKTALEQYKPIKVALLFSGGHDSLVNSHVCATILNALSIPFVVYHGDTTIGIPETQDYVRMICEKYGWDLKIRKPPNRKDWYDELVKKFGFPGPTRQSHQICYRRLKERALNYFVTHECKTTPHSREVVLLCSGVRKQESQIRMGYIHETSKIDSKVWTNPIFWWSEKECESYMKANDLPRNPVKDKLCISGECLCGAFAGNEEFIEIKHHYPEVAAKITALHVMAKENGKPWSWSSGPTEWRKHNPKNQISMFMCVGCDNKSYSE
jgi:3'-phosphoadenosine 5'-phosphosulfate sulfotransferase (PAPS reductase)/FAD synthetase